MVDINWISGKDDSGRVAVVGEYEHNEHPWVFYAYIEDHSNSRKLARIHIEDFINRHTDDTDYSKEQMNK